MMKLLVIAPTPNPRELVSPIEDYLEGEEKEMFIKLRDKALANREKAMNDPKAKLMAKIAKYQAELEALGE